MESGLDSEDFLFDSLQTLYDYQPITLAISSGTPFSYTLKPCSRTHEHTQKCSQPIAITLHTPDTEAANWALHASSIWMSSIYLADNLSNLNLDDHIRLRASSLSPSNRNKPIRILELGASAGLPSIAIATLFAETKEVLVTVTDYPDEKLIKTLSNNVERNGVAQRCTALPYGWGTNPSVLLRDTAGFDVVIAADTLWNSEFHVIFIDALKMTLRKSSTSRVHLVVGLHTGRYTIQSFLTRVLQSGFDLDSISEEEVVGQLKRNWDISRADTEDEKERRKWIIWIQLKWTKQFVVLHE